jgi:hypothetical protein
VRVTRAPASVRRRDIESLRKQGLTDRDILDAVQVISYFNYINRVADALGVEREQALPLPSEDPANQQAQARQKLHAIQSGESSVQRPEAGHNGWRRVAGNKINASAQRDNHRREHEGEDQDQS